MFEKLPDGVLGDRQATLAELRRRLGADSRLSGVDGRGGSGAVVGLDGVGRGSGDGVGSGSARGGSGGAVGVGASEGGPFGARGGYLPVLSPWADVLPGGGLPRGGVVALTGTGVTSALFTLLAGPGMPWAALVGLPNLGLLAAAELGVDLDRVVLIPDPGPDVLQVLSVLTDGVDLIAVRAARGPLAPPARLRVLQGRLRQRGTVLLAVGPWVGADLSLAVSMRGWRGIGAGHGRLVARELDVEVSGRGVAGRTRHTRLLLAAGGPGAAGQVLVSTAPVQERSAGLPVGLQAGLPVELPVAAAR
ncbi:hypothetical protein D1871_13210 [Nakamurella silvestris]|nr:hypothetical protein D1871_13210 [Nakamurella silvestris]